MRVGVKRRVMLGRVMMGGMRARMGMKRRMGSRRRMVRMGMEEGEDGGEEEGEVREGDSEDKG